MTQPVWTEEFTRRSLLQAIAAAVGVALSVDSAEAVRAAHESHGGARQSGKDTLSFLSAAEAADVEAITAQITPTDDTPGAREAGIVYFIDRALATFLAQLAPDYRAQLAEFQSVFHKQHTAAASFASLTSDQQIEYLQTIQDTAFFDATRLLTLLGMFSMPGYGGNRNEVGWKLIGFEDRHFFQPPFGYYDRDYPGFR
jgi:gluconate 2-dehydrogenase gamma chain